MTCVIHPRSDNIGGAAAHAKRAALGLQLRKVVRSLGRRCQGALERGQGKTQRLMPRVVRRCLSLNGACSLEKKITCSDDMAGEAVVEALSNGISDHLHQFTEIKNCIGTGTVLVHRVITIGDLGVKRSQFSFVLFSGKWNHRFCVVEPGCGEFDCPLRIPGFLCSKASPIYKASNRINHVLEGGLAALDLDCPIDSGFSLSVSFVPDSNPYRTKGSASRSNCAYPVRGRHRLIGPRREWPATQRYQDDERCNGYPECYFGPASFHCYSLSLWVAGRIVAWNFDGSQLRWRP